MIYIYISNSSVSKNYIPFYPPSVGYILNEHLLVLSHA